jgi:hypothetical protein
MLTIQSMSIIHDSPANIQAPYRKSTGFDQKFESKFDIHSVCVSTKRTDIEKEQWALKCQ